MKKLHQSFDKDSHSTQERQKRFCRQSTSKSPNSISNKSNDHSLSKFYIRNLNASNSNKDINSILTSTITHNLTAQITQPRNTISNKSRTEHIKYLTKQQLCEYQQKQLKELQSEIQKYQIYVQKQNQKCNEIKKRNEELEKLNIQQSRIKHELDEEIDKLRSKIAEKDIMLDVIQKQQPPLKKVKTAIMQTRALQNQKEKEQLNKRIKQLQIALQLQKSKKSQQMPLYPERPLMTQATSFSPRTNNPQPVSNGLTIQGFQKLQRQLYQSKQQIKRMQIQSACQQRKYFKQIQTLREKNYKQYEELKKKFMQLLEKYRINMKKVATCQINMIKQESNRVGRFDLANGLHPGRSKSKDSIDSLIFSSDQQKQAEIDKQNRIVV